MACGDVGGRVTDCAGSSVAVEWSDPEGDDGAPIPVRRLRLNLRNWVAVATANCRACAELATRGDERRNTAAHGHGHGISLGAFRTALVLGVEEEAGSVSWRSRARRLVGSPARRLDGPSAYRPSRPSKWQRPRKVVWVVKWLWVQLFSRCFGIIPTKQFENGIH